ncbi:MAG TPA: TIGR00730 family Rossman fold protein [Candidatus Paceibacterota bacterium]|jgi:hypothetical protein
MPSDEKNLHRRLQEGLCPENSLEKGPIDSWRVFKIIAEFVSGFEKLQRYCLAVTFFGTARCQFGDKVYEMATELSGKLSKEGFAVITGGGSGVMEAANRGAYEAKGASVGLHISLPDEQELNDYVTDSLGFHYFFTRKVMLAFASEVYVFFPGGFGTLDEFFELVMLVQTKKVRALPIVLIGQEYWKPLLEWIERDLYQKYHAIDKEDMEIYYLADSVEDAFRYIIEKVAR